MDSMVCSLFNEGVEWGAILDSMVCSLLNEGVERGDNIGLDGLFFA